MWSRVDRDTQERYAEYLYRSKIPMSHDAYLDEPGDVIRWTNEITAVVDQVKSKGRRGEGA